MMDGEKCWEVVFKIGWVVFNRIGSNKIGLAIMACGLWGGGAPYEKEG